MKRMTYTIGADPELCLKNNNTGKIVSSLPVLPDKHKPIELENGIRLYSDNVLVEVAFPPVHTKDEFIGIFRESFTRMKNHLGKDFSIVPIASHVYDKSELEDPKSWEIGCTANFNAYTESINPTLTFKNGLRTGSAHIHLGNEKLCDFHVRHAAIKLLDIIVGCSSVIFDKDKTSKARRKYYGAAGEFRPTQYGLEWRVLSPFVLRSPALIDLVYDLIDYAMAIVESNETENVLSLVKPNDVRKAINNCDIKLARKILHTIKLPLELMSRVESEYDTKDFNKNWGI